MVTEQLSPPRLAPRPARGRSVPRAGEELQRLRRRGGPKSEEKLGQRQHQPHPNRQDRKGRLAPRAGRRSAKPPRSVGRRNGPKLSQNRPSQRRRRRRSQPARSPRGLRKRPLPPPPNKRPCQLSPDLPGLVVGAELA